MAASLETIYYDPLPADGSQLRIVGILPSTKEAPLECLVENIPFLADGSDRIAYEALSYVWGDASVTRPISLNGQTFEVTVNLDAALRAIRSTDDIRLVWIDAICINQTSIEERNQEVRRMDEIYRRAAHVIIWLGRETEPKDIQVECKYIVEFTWAVLNELADCDPKDNEGAAMAIYRTGDETLAIRLLLRFFSRQWFLRVWILQEVALAQSATVGYGHRWISWDRLLLAVDALRRLQAGRNSHVWRLSGGGRADKVQRCWLRAKTNFEPEDAPSKYFELADLLWQTRFCERTDPRDRLYAILGLVKHDLRHEALLEVDYAKRAADVFRDMSIFMIQGGLLSQVLCSINGHMEGLPSWATTWTSTLVENANTDGSSASRISDGMMMYMQIHEIRGTTPPRNHPILSAKHNELTLRGRIVDAYGVRHIGQPFDRPALDSDDLDAVAQFYRSKLIYWEDEMERTPCAKQRFQTPAERRAAWKEALLHELRGDETETGQHYDMLTDREHELPRSKDSGLIARIVVDFQARLGNYLNLRRPFITTLGQMGSTGVNCEVRHRDQVCVFVGSAVPYLLRPIEGRPGVYKFVGCCWVPMLVDFDLTELQQQGLELQNITLV